MKKLEQMFNMLGMANPAEKVEQCREYMTQVLLANDMVNLTSITDKKDFEVKHFVDSLMAAKYEEFQESRRIIDVGTGGGFPGIPLAIAYPEKDFVLMDSLSKRIKILSDISREMGIKNVSFVHRRAEDLGQESSCREQFDLCVSRAVANLQTLAEYCLPFVKVGGYFISYKGREVQEEVERAENAVNVLGGEPAVVHSLFPWEKRLALGYQHSLIIIRKEKKTPEVYPRKAGTPSRKPIK